MGTSVKSGIFSVIMPKITSEGFVTSKMNQLSQINQNQKEEFRTPENVKLLSKDLKKLETEL